MLSDADIERLMQVFQDRMQDVTDEYLELIGKHIAEIGTLAPSDINRLIEMNRVNKDMSAIQRKLAAASGKSLQDIAKIFGAVAASDSRFAERYFGHKASASSMRRVIEAQMRVTHGAMTNISQTTLVSKPYRKAVDSAIQAVQSGVGDYRSSVRRALKNCAVQGLKVQYPSGRKVRADTAVRQNVLDGVRAVNQQMLYSIGEEFGANGVEITAHRLCAEDHLPYQGRQFDGKLFHEIQSSLRRPFGMWNCRHTMFPIILGVSEPAYSEEELREYREYSTEKIEIDGKTRTRYEWSQEMRRTETALRSERDAATLMKSAGDKEGVKESLRKQQELKDYYGKVSDASGVKKDWSRAQASGLARETGVKTPPMNGEDLRIPKPKAAEKETPPNISMVENDKSLSTKQEPLDKSMLIRTESASQLFEQGQIKGMTSSVDQTSVVPISETTKNRQINFEEINKSEWVPGAVPNSYKPVIDNTYTDPNGKVYMHGAIDVESGRKVKLAQDHSLNELLVAEILAREVGGIVHIMPRVKDPQKISCADYVIETDIVRYYADLKTLKTSGHTTIINDVLKSKKQAEYFIIDLTKTTIDYATILSNVTDIFRSPRGKMINGVVVVRNGTVEHVFQRNKK